MDAVYNHLIPFFRKCLEKLLWFVPLKNDIIFESTPDFADNTFFLYKELIRQKYNKKYRFIWLVTDDEHIPQLPENVIILLRDDSSWRTKLRYKLKIMRARFIIDCNDYVHKFHPRTVRIHLKHGLPIKDASSYTKQTGNVDLVCVPAEYWVPVSAKEHGVSEEVVKPLGFPRNTVLIPKAHNKKQIIWMPTYRIHFKDVQGFSKDFKNKLTEKMPFGLPCVPDIHSLRQINDLFAAYDADLLIRLHPVQDVSGIKFDEMSNIHLCNDEYLRMQGKSLYELLCSTDALITDYSSIYYDYLNLEKPIVLVVSDFDDYKKNNGIIARTKEEFKAAYPANYAESLTELMNFIEAVLKNETLVDLSSAKKKYMGSQSVDCCEKIIHYMNEHFDF